MRNTCAQSGICQHCRYKIVRSQPRQLWRAAEGALSLHDAEYCTGARNHAHKLAATEVALDSPEEPVQRFVYINGYLYDPDSPQLVERLSDRLMDEIKLSQDPYWGGVNGPAYRLPPLEN